MTSSTGGATGDRAGLSVLPALDGLRALAAGLVVLTHAAFLTGFGLTGEFAGRLSARGDVGVAIFFALSGYLLHRGLLRDEAAGHRRLGRYAARRAARVLPAYWVALLAVVLASRPDVATTLLHAAGLHVYVADASINAFGQAWSIATELSFYALLPAAVLALAPLGRHRPSGPLVALLVALGITSALGLLVGPVVFGDEVLLERLLPWRAPHFLVGMILAEMATHPRHPLSRATARAARDVSGCLLVAGAAFLLLSTPAAGPLNLEPAHGPALVVRTALGTVVAGALMAPLVLGDGGPWSRLLSQPAARWLGKVSYGIFLWHLPVFHALYAMSGLDPFAGGMIPLLALGVPVTLALATLSYYLIEEPASRAAARRGSGRPSSSSPQREQQDDPHHRLEGGLPR